MKRLAALVALSCLPGAAGAYQTDGWKWANAQASFHVSIPGNNGGWNTAFQEAMSRWTAVTDFTWQSTPDYADPCMSPTSTPYSNGVAFTSTACGDAWGANVLAMTWTWASGGMYVQADIAFNSTRTWSVYGGAWNGTADFRRVAVHELGHALGLNHESAVPAIMAPVAGNTEYPTADDVSGVASLYGSGGTDSDHDGVADNRDNCMLVANPDQRDADGDGYGNLCDADLNNTGTTTSTDSNLLRTVLSRSASYSALAAASDLNGSGMVTSADYNLMRARMNTVPGPSGLH
jgi:hypothetical protein